MNAHRSKTHRQHAALTLIELAVLIAVVVVLAGFIMPLCTSSAKRGPLTDSLSNAKQIVLALRMYAGDNDGKYPTRVDGKPLEPGDFSNHALEQVMPKYSTSKKIFMKKGSAWCSEPAVDSVTADSFRLKRGQNDWNYVTGLTDESNKEWPLIVTATQSASDLTYTNFKTARGGIWEGKNVIIGFVDGSARPLSGMEMDCTDKTKTFPKRKETGTNMLIGTPEWLGAGRLILAPE